MKIRLLLLIVLLIQPLFCFAADEDNVIVHWLKKIGNGDNLNEPAAPFAVLTSEIIAYQKKIGPPGPRSFITFMTMLDENSLFDRSQVDYTEVKGFRFKNTPHELIARVLARRTPIINEYEHDRTVYPDNDPRTMYREGNLLNEDYWSALQRCVVQRLIRENDLRFEKEVKDIADYLLAPLPDNKTYFESFTDEIKEVDARGACPVNTPAYLFETLLMYLNLFRKTRGEAEIDPYIGIKKLIEEYKFGENCRYYEQEKWKEYFLKPYTEEQVEEYLRSRAEQDKKK